jgi:hypothetical protein
MHLPDTAGRYHHEGHGVACWVAVSAFEEVRPFIHIAWLIEWLLAV